MATPSTLDLQSHPEPKRLAFYSALFAMSAADRDMDESEDDRIFETLDLEGLSGEARKQVFQLAIQPPPLERVLLEFRGDDLELRRALMLNLIDIVLADGIIEPGEHVGLHEARQVLGIDRDDMSDLHDLAHAIQSQQDVKRPVCPEPLSA